MVVVLTGSQRQLAALLLLQTQIQVDLDTLAVMVLTPVISLMKVEVAAALAVPVEMVRLMAQLHMVELVFNYLQPSEIQNRV